MSPGAFIGLPAVVANQDGRLQVFARGTGFGDRIPLFDPLDGGIGARWLYLLESRSTSGREWLRLAKQFG